MRVNAVCEFRRLIEQEPRADSASQVITVYTHKTTSMSAPPVSRLSFALWIHPLIHPFAAVKPVNYKAPINAVAHLDRQQAAVDPL